MAAAARRRVLFVAEAVTLAHVARPAALAAALDPAHDEVLFACAPHGRRFVELPAERVFEVGGTTPQEFTRRLAQGAPLLRADELRQRVQEDLALFERTRPDVVVGDFRLSLSISARVARVPCAFIANAYWSPYAADRRLPLPVLPWTRFVPIGPVEAAFNAVAPLVLAPHRRPADRVRRDHGLPPLPRDIRHLYTDADLVLYADDPALFPLHRPPPSHRHIGPVLWSPPVAPPEWWHAPREPGPLAYVTMGSSGDAGALACVLDGLAAAGIGALVSTAGAPAPPGRWPRVHMAAYLPGTEAAARADLVVCNGGSPTSQQALAAGVPVLGVCSNMDQMLNMRALENAGVGVALRADRLDSARVADAARRTLALAAASRARVTAFDAGAAFAAALQDLSSGGRA